MVDLRIRHDRESVMRTLAYPSRGRRFQHRAVASLATATPSEHGDPVDPFTRHVGPWTISHAPAGHNAYDRVLGRLSTWALEVTHATGWRIVEHEGASDAQIFSPGGLLVGVIDPDEYAPNHQPTLTSGRSALLTEALVAWAHAHAEEYGEPDIPET
jgi:hypothetical protein